MSNSDPFTTMADRIKHNEGHPFAGAAVLVDPDGNKIELLFLDEAKDTVQFWATIGSRVSNKIQEMNDRQKSQHFGMR